MTGQFEHQKEWQQWIEALDTYIDTLICIFSLKKNQNKTQLVSIEDYKDNCLILNKGKEWRLLSRLSYMNFIVG